MAVAIEPADANFVSKLDEEAKKKAKEELHEINDKDRENAVQTLRKWVLDQDWLKSPTDFAFLLRFLRFRKFSQLAAREALEHYWTNKQMDPKWFLGADPADKTFQDIVRSGFYLCPSKYDKHGRRIIFAKTDNLNMKDVDRWGLNAFYKTVLMLYDWLVLDENVQVHGLCMIADYSGMSTEWMKLFNLENKKKMMKYFEKCLPLRFKGAHVCNTPPIFDTIFAIIQPFMSQKIKSRFFMHGKSWVKIYEEFGMEVFPDEYLPDEYDGPSAGSVKDITEKMIADMMKPEVRNYLTDLSSGKYGVDMKKKTAGADSQPAASFRKLNID